MSEVYKAHAMSEVYTAHAMSEVYKGKNFKMCTNAYCLRKNLNYLNYINLFIYWKFGTNPTKRYKSSFVLATPIVCSSFADLIMAVERQQSGLFLVYMHVQQVQDDSNVVHLIPKRMRRKAPRRMRVWVRQWLDVDRRLQHGHYHRLMYGLRYKDSASYFNFLHVPPDLFDELLGRLGLLIAKQDTPHQKPLETGLKLAMAMRHLFNCPPGTGTPA